MTSRKRSSKKKTSPQSSSGNPCTNEEIVPQEKFEVDQEEKEAYWDALCGSITPPPKVFFPTRPATQFDLTLPNFEGLWSTRMTSIDYSYRMAPKRHMSIIQGHTSNAKGWFERFFYVRIDGASVEENCLPLFRGKWNFHRSNSILPAIPRDLFAKLDLLRNGPFFWDSFTLDRIRNAVALYRSRGIFRPLHASDMDLLLPGWNPGFTPGDGSGTSEAPLPNDFFTNLPPGFTTPASLDEASRREAVAEGSRLINEV
ncbi:hypothetical protein Bca101_050570 [Brassica carinata]